MRPEFHLNYSHDAVVMIPGIMGSALVDTVTRKTLWGLNHLGWYGRAWRDGSSLRELSDLEPGRIQPQGLLRFPAWAPLGYFEPYDRLIRHLKEMVHHRAVCEFAYDWRLPVLHNARLLARAAHGHLMKWRADPDHERLRELQSNRSPARLVFVAHSMGGLLVRALPLVEGTDDDAGVIPAVTRELRATVTLGTPFRGAAKTAVILASGRDLLPPRRHMTQLARKLPGIYDLLPSYKCVNEEDESVRALTVADVARFGGDPAEAQRAYEFRNQLDAHALIGHYPVIGVGQPTVTLLRLAGGTVEGLGYTYHLSEEDGEIVRDERIVPVRFPTEGDGIVPVDSAALPEVPADPRALQHGSLAHADSGIEPVRWVITGGPRGSGLGPGDRMGIDTPDVVPVGAEFPVAVSGEGAADAVCRVTDAETGVSIGWPKVEKTDGQWVFNVSLPEEHLYEIMVDGGESPLKRMTLAASPGESANDILSDE